MQSKGGIEIGPAETVLASNISIWQYSYMAMNAQDSLSLTFQALADPTRRGILSRLASGGAGVSELTKQFALSQPTISKHLKVLERAGLVAGSRDAQRRPRTLVTAPLQDVDRWLDAYRRSWEAQFASLDDYLLRMEKKGKRHGRKSR